jgi:hypothetical protein
MLGIHSKVAARPVTISGKDVAGFVPGLSFATDRKRKLQNQDDEKKNQRTCENTTARVVVEFLGRGSVPQG